MVFREWWYLSGVPLCGLLKGKVLETLGLNRGLSLGWYFFRGSTVVVVVVLAIQVDLDQFGIHVFQFSRVDQSRL